MQLTKLKLAVAIFKKNKSLKQNDNEQSILPQAITVHFMYFSVFLQINISDHGELMFIYLNKHLVLEKPQHGK